MENPSNRQQLFEGLIHLFANSTIQDPVIFTVDIISLISRSSSQLELFRANPSIYLKDMHNFLKTKLKQKIKAQSFEDMIKFHRGSIVLSNIPFCKKVYLKLNSLSHDDIGKWVVLTGTVVQALQTKALEKSKIFACNECSSQYRLQNSYQNYYRFDLPQSCSNLVQKQKSDSLFTMFYKNMSKRKGQTSSQQNKQEKAKIAKCGCSKFSPTDQKKICLDYQQIRIQQQFKHIAAGRLPQTLTIIIESGVGCNWRPGDDIVVSGILDYRFKKPAIDQTIQLQMILVSNSISCLKTNSLNNTNDRQTQMDQTQSNIQSISYNGEFTSTQKQIQMRNAIVQKFSPNIYGRQAIKLGLILSLLGGVSISNQNTKIRGQSHVLLVGQPGTGKSVLIKQAANLAQRSFFTNGIGTSSAGLSVSYYKDGSDWTIQPGALVLADNGVCCIDELTLLSKKDENSLLEAMEQQTVCSAKASVVGKLNARTTVICACNPITPNQRYDPGLDLQVNTGLSIPLLTRFDLILIVKDENTRMEDSTKCDHILQKFTGQQNAYQQSKNQFSLKGLLKRCRLYEPELRGGDLLSKYYIQQRQNVDKITTARAFQSLCRLSQAHAKLMMRDFTTEFDCLTAIMLTEGKYAINMEEYGNYVQSFNKKYKTNVEIQY